MEEPSQPALVKPEVKRVSDVVITDQLSALNGLVGFVTLAQQRGAYSIEESAKIWECINVFKNKSSS